MKFSSFLLGICFLLACLAFSGFAAECQVNKDCETCAKDTTCVWCESESSCIKGSYNGPEDDEQCPEGNWGYGQCVFDGQTLVWVGVGVGGAVILIVAFVIWYFCCCKRNKKKEQALLDDYERKFEEKPKKFESSKWQEKRSEMNAKYGWNQEE